MFLDETASATRAYNAQIMKMNAARDERIAQIRTMHRELLQEKDEMVRSTGWFNAARLDSAAQIEWGEYEQQIRDVDRWYRSATAPIKDAYTEAIAPAQARLQEARSKGRSKSPSELARERQVKR